MNLELIGYTAGVLSLIGYLPQTIKTIRTRQTDDLSLSTFGLLGASALLWIAYGLMRSLPAIWAPNSVVLVCTVVISIIKLNNRREQS